MATGYYKLPTVDPDSTLSFPDAVNGLAVATDDVLQDVQDGFGHMDVTDLPTASTKEVGVVRIGDGFRTYADGTLVTSKPPFKLKPAKQDTLGGIYIGDNIDVEKDGAISINMGAFNVDSISGASIANGVVTTEKIAPYAVDDKKIGGSIVNDINKVENLFTNSPALRLGDDGGDLNDILINQVSDQLWVARGQFFASLYDTMFWGSSKYVVDQGKDKKGFKVYYSQNRQPGYYDTFLPPAGVFTQDVTISAFLVQFVTNKYEIIGTSTVTIHGSTGLADRKIIKSREGTPTGIYLPPTIISL